MKPFTATKILPNLYLGTREDAEALGKVVPNDWACISVTEYRSRYKRTEELPNEPDGSLDLPFMTDSPNGWHADRHKLDLIAETIWWRLVHGKRVLVHCIHAQERSPLAVAWYLAWSGEASSMERAYEIVCKKHQRTERRDKWLRDASPKMRFPGTRPATQREIELAAKLHEVTNCLASADADGAFPGVVDEARALLALRTHAEESRQR